MRFYATYLAQRLGQFLLVVFIGINLTYLITHLTPIDPVDLRAPLAALEASPPSGRTADATFDGELALCAAVVERVEALWRVAEGP